jgi:folylpolyglutamate synthase
MTRPGQDYVESLTTLNSTQLHGDLLRRAYSTRRDTVKAMNVYLQRLGLVEGVATLPTLHVTGSKGKGSTCAIVEAVLRRQGVRTVLFTSPHLVRVNERIRLDGQPLTDTEWSHHFWAVWNRLQETAPPPPAPLSMPPDTTSPQATPLATTTQEAEPEAVPGYFRFMTLLCFWVAVQERADVLILEVGVGGRFDATNVVPRPVACAITTLDLEHTDLLGTSIEEIAWEKGGIIKPGVPCFVSPQPPRHAASALRVLRTCTLEAPGAALHFVKPLAAEIKLGIAGDFQAMNAALALALVQQYHASQSHSHGPSDVSHHTNEIVDDEAAATEAWVDVIPYLLAHEPTVREGLEGCAWPGRCQRLEWGPCCRFFIDGAHTEESMRTAIEWFDGQVSPREEGHGHRRRVLIFNCGEEKTVPDLLSHLVINRKRHAAFRFDVVLFCPVASAKPTLAHARAARVLLLEEGEEGAYARKLDQATLRSLCDALDEKKKGQTENLQWQRALRDTWRVLQAYHMKTQQQQQQEEEEKEADWIERADRQTRTAVLPSVVSALEEIKAMLNVETLEVLVTGSLYLVGNVLGRLEEEPSPLPPPSPSSSST